MLPVAVATPFSEALDSEELVRWKVVSHVPRAREVAKDVKNDDDRVRGCCRKDRTSLMRAEGRLESGCRLEAHRAALTERKTPNILTNSVLWNPKIKQEEETGYLHLNEMSFRL